MCWLEAISHNKFIDLTGIVNWVFLLRMKCHSFAVCENELLEDPFTVFFNLWHGPSSRTAKFESDLFNNSEDKKSRKFTDVCMDMVVEAPPPPLLPATSFPSTINGCEFSHTVEIYLHPFKTYNFQTWQVYYLHGGLHNGGDGFC